MTQLARDLRVISAQEHPPHQEHGQQRDDRDGRVLAQQQLQVDLARGAAVLLGVLSQRGAQVAHLVERVAAVQQVLDVLGHDLLDAREVLVELVQVVLHALVAVELLGLLQEVVECDERVGPHGRLGVLVAVGVLELLRDLAQVREREVARVPALGDDEVRDAAGARVVDVEVAALQGGLVRGAGR